MKVLFWVPAWAPPIVDSVDAGNKMSNIIPGSALFTFGTCLIMLVCLVPFFFYEICFFSSTPGIQCLSYQVPSTTGHSRVGARTATDKKMGGGCCLVHLGVWRNREKKGWVSWVWNDELKCYESMGDWFSGVLNFFWFPNQANAIRSHVYWKVTEIEERYNDISLFFYC